MNKYTIQAGQHDFKPRDGFGLIGWNIPFLRSLKRSALVVSVKFKEDCLYPFTHPLNKLPGISLNPFWVEHNQEAVMLSWRSSPEDYAGFPIQTNPYQNYEGGKHGIGWKHGSEAEKDAAISPGVELVYIIWFDQPNRAGVKVFLKDGGKALRPQDAINEAVYFDWPDKKPWLYNLNGLWFGGKGPAPQAMTIEVHKAWKSKWELKRQKLI